MTVYFIQNTVTKNIKIGFTDDGVKTILNHLQKFCCSKLEILFSIIGGEKVEKYFHDKFAAYETDVNSKWFYEECIPFIKETIKNMEKRNNTELYIIEPAEKYIKVDKFGYQMSEFFASKEGMKVESVFKKIFSDDFKEKIRKQLFLKPSLLDEMYNLAYMYAELRKNVDDDYTYRRNVFFLNEEEYELLLNNVFSDGNCGGMYRREKISNVKEELDIIHKASDTAFVSFNNNFVLVEKKSLGTMTTSQVFEWCVKNIEVTNDRNDTISCKNVRDCYSEASTTNNLKKINSTRFAMVFCKFLELYCDYKHSFVDKDSKGNSVRVYKGIKFKNYMMYN